MTDMHNDENTKIAGLKKFNPESIDAIASISNMLGKWNIPAIYWLCYRG